MFIILLCVKKKKVILVLMQPIDNGFIYLFILRQNLGIQSMLASNLLM